MDSRQNSCFMYLYVSSTHHLEEYFVNTFTISSLFVMFILVSIIIAISPLNFLRTQIWSSEVIPGMRILSDPTIPLIFFFMISQFLSRLSVWYSKFMTLFLTLIVSAKFLSLIFLSSLTRTTSLVHTARMMKVSPLSKSSWMIFFDRSYHRSITHIPIFPMILITSSIALMLSLFSLSKPFALVE